MSSVKFWSACAKEAVHGSLGRTNNIVTGVGAITFAALGRLLDIDVVPNGALGIVPVFVIAFVAVWTLLFLFRLIFLAPHHLFSRLSTENAALWSKIADAAPIRLVYDENDQKFVRQRRGVEYRIGVFNASLTQTVEEVTVTGDDGPFLTFLASFSRKPIGLGPITLNPGVMEYVHLIEMLPGPLKGPGLSTDHEAEEILGRPHEFRCWASGRNAQEVRIVMEYVPNATPCIRVKRGD